MSIRHLLAHCRVERYGNEALRLRKAGRIDGMRLKLGEADYAGVDEKRKRAGAAIFDEELIRVGREVERIIGAEEFERGLHTDMHGGLAATLLLAGKAALLETGIGLDTANDEAA